jgi:2-dehydropantoate 2-reductase
VVVGEIDGSLTPRLQAVVEAFQPTGVTIETTPDITRILWTKFAFIAAVSGVGALTRLAIGDVRSVPETRRLLAALVQEVDAVGRAAGASLDLDVVDRTLAFIDELPPHTRASLQRDVEAGRRFELEAIIGVIGRKGREFGIPTPLADFIYAALLPLARKAEGREIP